MISQDRGITKGRESYLTIREKRLKNEANLIESVDHKLTKGGHLEGLLINFLNKELPRKYAVDSGFVIGRCKWLKNSQNKKDDIFLRSYEMDIVIYDEQSNVSPLRLLRKKDFFIESVYAVISVKKNLTKDYLIGRRGNMIDNLLSARMILPNHYSMSVFGKEKISDVSGLYTPAPILALGFAYEGISLKTVKNILDSQISNYGPNWYEKMPNLIAILNQGVVSLEENAKGVKEYIIINTHKNTLEEFFLNLIDRLNAKLERPVVGLKAYRNFYSNPIKNVFID